MQWHHLEGYHKSPPPPPNYFFFGGGGGGGGGGRGIGVHSHLSVNLSYPAPLHPSTDPLTLYIHFAEHKKTRGFSDS